MSEFESRSSLNVYRGIDANLNRAGEGLRVVEDIFRFSINDSFLSMEIKNLRHLLAEIVTAFPQQALIRSRHSQADVGRELQVPREYDRGNLVSILRANFTRAAQSVRSLEEHAKLLNVTVAARFESLRYQIYDLQKAAESLFLAQEKLHNVRLCVLVDCSADEETFRQTVEKLLAADQPLMLQLRDKSADDRLLVRRGKCLSSALRERDSIWVMNDRADLAIASNADGVHVGQTDLSVCECQRIVGPQKIVGVSTHDLLQVEQAIIDGASYIGVGPVFESPTKSFDRFPGLDFVEQVAGKTALPAFAIGGIDRERLNAVCDRGLFRVAVSNAISEAADITAEIAFLSAALRDLESASRGSQTTS